MKAAVVREAGHSPILADFAEPAAEPGEVIVEVAAAAVSPLARGRARGSHYSVAGGFPFVAGVDGVGHLADGRRVYFALPRAPFGAIAERVPVPAAQCVEVPDGLDDVAAAALANPAMSSFAALTERAVLRPGETVLVNGATGTAGRLAIGIARHLGAGRVIATGRNAVALATLGADETLAIPADDGALDARLREIFAGGVDVVLDYLWGRTAERLLVAAARAKREDRPVRFVQIGAASGGEITLPGAALRAAPIALMGSGIGSVPAPRLLASVAAAFAAAGPAGLAVETVTAPFADVERAWNAETGSARLVLLGDRA
ncbi:zinc-binding alcohol dehydrogenase family protein [Ancylobacter sp. 6x-1]|uniref:Zinc-binding alcohol dehydrogenase family protein n=1 Tax=Ancylobacter crimeensis TaxID=2579147 RepID=A0ABT0D692_9HYPH|nr:zinc-binding alcohol dehydrogenase family protein [Ancylobacter crimeensis]MCK0195473.1 zinc-binding alcohol dehydrogenase family protein [Ancylobacter crimeensis]